MRFAQIGTSNETFCERGRDHRGLVRTRRVVGVTLRGRDVAVPHPFLEGAHRHAGRGHRGTERVAQVMEAVRGVEPRSLERPPVAPRTARSLSGRPLSGSANTRSSSAWKRDERDRSSSSRAGSSASGTLLEERLDFGVPYSPRTYERLTRMRWAVQSRRSITAADGAPAPAHISVGRGRTPPPDCSHRFGVGEPHE
jgi:hypothetical protein